MRTEKVLSVTRSWLFWKSTVEDVAITRISPRSYWAGEKSGFVCGITIGFVFGILFMCLVWATVYQVE